MAADFLSTARFHRRFRYVGMLVFMVAASAALVTIGTVVMGGLPLRNLLLCVFALGTALGAFGTSNDTALHAMVQVEPQLSPPEAEELHHERAVRGARLASTHASPKMAFVLPIVSLMVSVLLLSRVVTAMEAQPAAGWVDTANGEHP